METQIATSGNGALARQQGPMEFSAEQRKMILGSFLSGATEAEAAVLLELARLRRLNPITRQIHFVKRWDHERAGFIWAAQVGIDGFRAIAERTGVYAGQDEPEYDYDAKGALRMCRVKVYRSDWTRASVGVAHYAEYVQRKKDGTLTAMWANKPHVMLAKCAEALALRKAFPDDVSGLYTPEETEGDDNAAISAPTPAAPRASQTASVKALLARHVVDVAPEVDSRELENAQAEAAILIHGAASPAPAPAPAPAAPPVRKARARIVDVAPNETEADAEARQGEPPPPGDEDAPPIGPGRAQSPPPKAGSRPAAPSAGAITMSFGKGKGVPLADLQPGDLQWYAKVLAEGVDDPAKARFRDDDQRKLAAINAELATRADS